MTDRIMGDVDINFDKDYQRYHIKIPSRKERIVVEKLDHGSSLFKIRYESGVPIPELNGTFTGKTEAFRALRKWIDLTKPTKEVLRDEWFGEENPPELKRKKVVQRRRKVEDVDDTNTSTTGG